MCFQAFLLFYCQGKLVLGQLRGQRHDNLLGLRHRRREDTHHDTQAIVMLGGWDNQMEEAHYTTLH